METSIQQLFEQALSSHKEGQYDAARRGYREVIAVAPEHGPALHHLGLAEFELGNHAAALHFIAKSLEIAPREVTWLVNFGEVSLLAGRRELARTAFNAVLSLDPQCAAAIEGLTTLSATVEPRPPAPQQVDKRPVIPCHLNQPFIKSDGSVSPCCRLWNDDKATIGHFEDPDLLEKFVAFDIACSCNLARFRKKRPDEEARVDTLNIELSLACQGKCAMCCVGSPDWKGTYDLYNALTTALRTWRPRRIAVQGGEILIQKKSMRWLAEVKNEFPDMEFHVITNGNVDTDIIPVVESLFETMTISIVGFEPETYKKIMGLELAKTIRFAEELISRGKVEVALKHLLTPLNFHQSGRFLDWVVETKPTSCQLTDCGPSFLEFINRKQKFWDIIIERTGEDVRQAIGENKDVFKDGGIKIFITPAVGELFGVTDDFAKEHGLDELICVAG